MISFRDLCKSHNFGAKETQTEYLKNVLYKKKCQTDFHGLHTIRRPLEARSYTKEFNRKPGRPSFWRKIK